MKLQEPNCWLWSLVFNTMLALLPMGNCCKVLSLTRTEGVNDLRLIWLRATKYFVHLRMHICCLLRFKPSQFDFVGLNIVFLEEHFKSGSKPLPQYHMNVHLKIVQHYIDTFSYVSDIHITEHVDLGSFSVLLSLILHPPLSNQYIQTCIRKSLPSERTLSLW